MLVCSNPNNIDAGRPGNTLTLTSTNPQRPGKIGYYISSEVPANGNYASEEYQKMLVRVQKAWPINA